MPTSSSHTRSISAAPRPCAKLPASRSRTSSPIWLIGRRKIAMRFYASSTATREVRKVRHEALLRVSPAGGRFGHPLGSRRTFPRPGGSRAISLAQAKALLRDPLRRSQTYASDRMFHHRSPLLHTQSYVEAELVPARFRL